MARSFKACINPFTAEQTSSKMGNGDSKIVSTPDLNTFVCNCIKACNIVQACFSNAGLFATFESESCLSKGVDEVSCFILTKKVTKKVKLTKLQRISAIYSKDKM